MFTILWDKADIIERIIDTDDNWHIVRSLNVCVRVSVRVRVWKACTSK